MHLYIYMHFFNEIIFYLFMIFTLYMKFMYFFIWIYFVNNIRWDTQMPEWFSLLITSYDSSLSQLTYHETYIYRLKPQILKAVRQVQSISNIKYRDITVLSNKCRRLNFFEIFTLLIKVCRKYFFKKHIISLEDMKEWNPHTIYVCFENFLHKQYWCFPQNITLQNCSGLKNSPTFYLIFLHTIWRKVYSFCLCRL